MERDEGDSHDDLVRTDVDGDRGVAPVLGIIMLVAIAVILSVVIGQYVFGLDIIQSQKAGPQVSFQTEYDDSATQNTLTLRHEGGSDIEDVRHRLSYAVSNNGELSFEEENDVDYSGVSGSDLTSTDEIVLSDIAAGATVRVIWTDSNTGDALVIFKWEGGR